MLNNAWNSFFETQQKKRKLQGSQRKIQDIELPLLSRSKNRVLYKGKEYISFSSNDYLGLSKHPCLIQASIKTTQEVGTGSSSSRLVAGTHPLHTQLEQSLARFQGFPSALVFSTGYQANLGLLSSLADAETLIVSDEMNHASIIDGCRLGRSKVAVFNHRDYSHAEKILNHNPCSKKIIVSDTLFSMKGSRANLQALVTLSKQYQALLVLDDAHAFGVLGKSGRGLLEQENLSGNEVDVVTGSFSKALGALGGYVCCSQKIREQILNTARSFIYTTALNPPSLAAALAGLEIIQSNEGCSRRKELLSNAFSLHQEVVELGFSSDAQDHIIPLWFQNERDAVLLSDALFTEGFYIPAIRPPTVPKGFSMLRLSLSSGHSWSEDILPFLEALVKAWSTLKSETS